MVNGEENIKPTNEADVNNTQVDHANNFSELPFSEHNEFDNEVASTDGTQASETQSPVGASGYDTLLKSSDAEDNDISKLDDDSELKKEKTTLINMHNESLVNGTPGSEMHSAPISDSSEGTLTEGEGHRFCLTPFNSGEDSKIDGANSDTNKLENGSEPEGKENIGLTNETDVNNTQVDHANNFSELFFSEHNEFNNEVASTDGTQATEKEDDTDGCKLENNPESERKETTSEEDDKLTQNQVNKRRIIHASPEVAKIPEDNESLTSSSNIPETSGLSSVKSSSDIDGNISEIEDDSESEEGEKTLINMHNESLVNGTPDFEMHSTPISDVSEETLIKDEGHKLYPIPLNGEEDSKVNDVNAIHEEPSRVNEGHNTQNKIDYNLQKKKELKSPNFSKGEKVLLSSTALLLVAFIASSISSVLGKPLCPDAKGNLISLAVLGTAVFIATAVSLAYFCCSDKSKENLPSDKLNLDKVGTLGLESKKNI